MLNQSMLSIEHAKLQLGIQTAHLDWQNLSAALTRKHAAVATAAAAAAQANSVNYNRDPLYVVVPITVLYAIIFVAGLVGNVSTCIVIARNKFMHTATNYYLFSLAISDLLLLISGLPPEIYHIWSKYPYIFGETFCVISGFTAETSATATVLIITAFTVERYFAICHPFFSHKFSKLSRVVKFIVFLWILALGMAVPEACQFGIVYQKSANGTEDERSASCSLKSKWYLHYIFMGSSVLLFVLPMLIITILYMLIGMKLKQTRLLNFAYRNNLPNYEYSENTRAKGQRNVIRMLVAVVAAFFICWAPFHAQRLLAVYAHYNKEDERKTTIVLPFYTILTYVSGFFYYLSTAINPVLYNLMSKKFRDAFKAMLSKDCDKLPKSSPCRLMYSSIARYPRLRSTTHCVDPQASGSLSISEETQKLAPSVDCSRKTSANPLLRCNTSSSFATDKNNDD